MSENIKTSAFIVQLFSTIVVAYLTALTGLIYTWPSTTVDMFGSNQTTLSEPMTPLQQNLLGSVPNIGALGITPFCGYIVDNLGRKYSAILFGIPYVVSWSIIMITKNINMVLFAMFFVGIGAAGQVVSTVYISEIVQDSIRGGLATSTVTGYFVGVLISYTLGGQLNYYQVIYTNLSLALLYILLLTFLKESPVFLIRQGKDEEAAKSIAFYRRLSRSSKEVEVEVNHIKRLFEPQFQILPQSEISDINVTTKNLKVAEMNDCHFNRKHISPWKFLLKSKSSQRAIITVLVLMSLTILMGSVVLQVYAEPLFKDAVPSISSNLCAILLAIDFLVAGLISSLLTDKVGRKNLTTCSSFAAGIATLLLGLQLHFSIAPHWFTAIIIYIYVFVYTLGAATTPFVLTAEVFLPEVKSLCNSMSIGCMWVMCFATLTAYNYLVEIIGLGPMFYIFSAMCFLGGLYSHFCLPETKGLPVEVIQTLFYKKRRGSIL